MKIKKVKFENHKILKDLEVDFCDEKGEILDVIVLIGENGTGKTTLLKEIFNFFKADEDDFNIAETNTIIKNSKGNIELQTNKQEGSVLCNKSKFGESKNSICKVIFMPTEINFDKFNKVDNTFDFTSDFLNIINQNITQNIPSFIATKINKEIFKNRNKVIGEVIDSVCNEINSIFKTMDLDIKLIGLSEDEKTTPVFVNNLGAEFDINGLSSGEKQLFLRALSLKFLDVNNSVILIDEPEISLHPNWQQKIIKAYQNIGNNNQLIIATHSPHIIADIKSQQLRVMTKNDTGIKLLDNEELTETNKGGKYFEKENSKNSIYEY